MDTKFAGLPEGEGKIVYVRPVAVADLPAEVQAHAGRLTTIYALHDVDGDRLALVRDRAMAFALARANDMAPVNVH
ncbi:DUF1150 family protein [Paragemmobacter straminiformis]|uniref:DUF1150 family protein n=1 Tax=Paragemmobacter straminiformis TaxID=2045119 RepID=A0A842I5H5_9RHOB|nr:DUF1150 family protein [Gemmobacter straminiformis]MBC2834855.1 DUF1150 family protein [Gemmobacter straminiformis]